MNKLAIALLVTAGITTLAIVSFSRSRTQAEEAIITHSTMEECENGVCGFWAFDGNRGVARWRNGAFALLTLTSVGRDGLVVERTDTSGPSVGLTATYEGKRQGTRIEGTVIWRRGGGSGPGRWSATFEEVSADEAWTRASKASAKGDTLEEMRWLLAGVALGDARAQNEAGIAYADGNVVPRDYVTAAQLFRAAAEQGNTMGEINLARFYSEGMGVPQSQSEADKWYGRAGPAGAQAAAQLAQEKAAAASRPTTLGDVLVEMFGQASGATPAQREMARAIFGSGDANTGPQWQSPDADRQPSVGALEQHRLDNLNEATRHWGGGVRRGDGRLPQEWRVARGSGRAD
jgi:hypothetical protein